MPVELELKYVASDSQLTAVVSASSIGAFDQTSTHEEHQTSVYFDTARGDLSSAGVYLRSRTVPTKSASLWTIKGKLRVEDGVAQRMEIEAELASTVTPREAVASLTHQIRDDQVRRAITSATDAELRAILTMRTHRICRTFVRGDTVVEVAADRVRLDDLANYEDLELEAELKAGQESGLVEFREALLSNWPLQPSVGSKLDRAQYAIESQQRQTFEQ